VPRLIPRISLWRDSQVLIVAPSQLYKSVRDSFLLMLVILGFDLIDVLQAWGWLPVLFKLP
jgi:hypothetical protein